MYRLTKIFCIIIFLSFTILAQQFWEQTNGPIGGYFVSVKRGANNQMVAGTVSGSIFYSLNNGESWYRASNKFDRNIEDFIYLNDSTIFAATYLNGVQKSTNFGKDWVPNTLSNVRPWSIEQGNDGSIFVGARDPYEVYRSLDSGKTWTKILNDGGWSLHFSRFNKYIYSANSGRVYRSTNNGNNWSSSTLGLPSGAGIECFESDSSGNVYLGTDTWGSVYKSTDLGITWYSITIGSALEHQKVTSIIKIDSTIIVSTYSGMFRTRDEGVSWEKINNGLLGNNVTYIDYDGSTNLYIASYGGGIYKSSDKGDSWQLWSNGIFDISTSSLEFDSNQTLFAPCYGAGVYKSTNFGSSWQLTNNGLTESGVICSSISPEGIIYLGTQNGVFISDDNGESWKISPVLGVNFILSITTSINENVFVGTAGDGIYRSTDRGNSWIQVNQGLSNLDIVSLKFDLDNTLYAGTHSGRIFISTDYGDNWNLVNDGLNFINIISFIEVDSSAFLYLGTRGDGIFRTSDRGVTWKEKNSGLGNRYVLSIKSISSKTILVGTLDGGIYFSNDVGENWHPFNSGLPSENITVESITMDKNGFPFIGTAQGVFKGSSSTITDLITLSVNHNIEFILYPNYPNPFNPSTTINYSLPSAGKVVLKIYNALGEEVKTLVDEYQEAGFHSKLFIVNSSQPSGVYFYQLKAGSYVETKKMILMK